MRGRSQHQKQKQQDELPVIPSPRMSVHLFSRAVFRSSLHLVIYWRGWYTICLKAFYDEQTLLCWSAIHFVPCVLYRPLGCERGNLCIIYAMTFLRCRAMGFVCIFIILEGGVSVTQFASGYHGSKKNLMPSKCISIFIPLLPQSQKEGFY